MKDLAKPIINFVNDQDNSSRIESFVQKNPNFIYNDITSSDIIDLYDMLEGILQNSELLKNFSYLKKKKILGVLTKIDEYLEALHLNNFNLNAGNGKEITSDLFNCILELEENTLPIQLSKNIDIDKYENDLKEFLKYNVKLKNTIRSFELFNYEKDKYKELLREIVNMNAEFSERKKSFEEGLSKLQLLKNQVEEINLKITQTATEVESKKITINSLHQNADEVSNKIKNTNSELNNFINESKKNVDIFLKKQVSDFDAQAKGLSSKNENISKEIGGIRKRINELLEGANAGRLHKSFSARKNQIQRNLYLWFSGIVFTNVALVAFTLMIINGCHFLGIKELDVNNLNGAFYIKLFISIPLLFLDYFFIHEYNLSRELIEKYAFKSVLSVSLLAYIEMINERGNDKDSKDFINKTVELIYESPFERDGLKFSKEYFSLIRDLTNKGLEKLPGFNKN